MQVIKPDGQRLFLLRGSWVRCATALLSMLLVVVGARQGLAGASGRLSPRLGGPARAIALSGHENGSGAATDGSYAIVDTAGRIATYGGAAYSGDAIGLRLNRPVVGAAADASRGYWMDAADGGVFAFGGAAFYGSMGGRALNQPVVGMAGTPSGQGYWLVAADGGVFAFGDAAFYGSMGGQVLNAPVVGMAGTHDGHGYLMVAADGGVFAFGDAAFYGSLGGHVLSASVSSLSLTPDDGGYWMIGTDSALYAFGDAQYNGGGTTTMLPPLYPGFLSAAFVPAVAVLSLPQGPETAQEGPIRVAVVGDSLGTQESAYTSMGPPAFLNFNGATPGCGTNAGTPMIMYSNPTAVSPKPSVCALWTQQFNWVAHIFHANVIVMQGGFWDVQPTLFDGAFVTLNDPSYARVMAGYLQQAVSILHSTGAQVILNTAPFYGDGTPNVIVGDYNRIAREVGANNASFVSILDVNTLVCPSGTYQPYIGGVLVRPDAVHLTPAAITGFIDPTLIPMVSALASRVRPSSP